MNLATFSVAAAIAGLVATLALAVAWEHREQREWEAYAAAHNCRVVGHEPARYVGAGGSYDSQGRYLTAGSRIPERTTYRCEDGREVVR